MNADKAIQWLIDYDMEFEATKEHIIIKSDHKPHSFWWPEKSKLHIVETEEMLTSNTTILAYLSGTFNPPTQSVEDIPEAVSLATQLTQIAQVHEKEQTDGYEAMYEEVFQEIIDFCKYYATQGVYQRTISVSTEHPYQITYIKEILQRYGFTISTARIGYRKNTIKEKIFEFDGSYWSNVHISWVPPEKPSLLEDLVELLREYLE